MRRTLVTALASCADDVSRARTRSFLRGLSSDELQFIAEFLGACILESARRSRYTRAQLAQRIADFQHLRLSGSPISPDQEHKMILLLEFLCRSSLEQLALPARLRPVSH